MYAVTMGYFDTLFWHPNRLLKHQNFVFISQNNEILPNIEKQTVSVLVFQCKICIGQPLLSLHHFAILDQRLHTEPVAKTETHCIP